MRSMRSLIPLLGLAASLAAGPAAAVTVTCGTGSGLAGQTINIALTSTDLTALGVKSYQFSVAYNPTQVTALGVVTTGTLTGTAGWSAPTVNVTSGLMQVSAAGTTTLTGAGTLLQLSFQLNPALLNGGFSSLSLQNFIMNEGTPIVTTANGSITINLTPRITVSPDGGELAKTQTQQYSVSGNVTLPVTWHTTNTAVATISSTGLLTGVGVGNVRVYAVDNAGLKDTTDADLLVRGMVATVGTSTVLIGQPVTIPVNVTTLTGLGIRSGEFKIAFNPAILTLTSATTPGGTLLNGYGSLVSYATNGVATVDFAGTTDLAGAGTMFYLNFTTVTNGFTGLTLNTALFNETLPAIRVSGTVTVNALPTINITPDQVTLFTGQTQAFSVTGSPTLPLTWSTYDPTVATINSSGLLTAVGGGVTRVHVVDNVGAADDNTSVTVYDFQLSIGNTLVNPGATVHVPIKVDRSIVPFHIFSFEYTLNYGTTWITNAAANRTDLIASWGNPATYGTPGKLRVAAGGSAAIAATTTTLHSVDLTVSASAPPGTVIPLTLTGVIFNEGHPLPVIAGGQITVSTTTGVPFAGGVLSFAAPQPNPASSSASLSFTLPQAGDVRLVLYGLDGRLVRVLIDGPRAAGLNGTTWDLRDSGGRGVEPGVYFSRLEWGGHTLERRIAVIR
jgi:Bacterial Ig-like domain (group 2)/Cohesin domain